MNLKKQQDILWRETAKAAGLLMVALGAVMAVSPLPAGILIALFGIVILIPISRTTRRHVRKARGENRWLDKLVTRSSRPLPRRAREVLARTRPGREPE